MGNEEIYGGFFVAQIFQKHNIKHVFFLTGGHIAPILIGCKRLGIEAIDVRHEVTTVFAADAYSRLSDKVGVAIVTAGPGITNIVTAVKNAQMAQSPVVIIGGAPPMIYKGKDALQDIDQIAIMKSLVKWHVVIKSYKQITKVSEAFYRAKEGVPGPVFIEMSLDLLWPASMTIGGYTAGANRMPKTLFGRMQKTFLNLFLNRMMKGYTEFKAPEPIPLERKASKVADLQKTTFLLENSERPVLLIGSQAIEYGTVNDLVQAVEKLKLPVYLSGMARGLLGKDNPLQFRHKRRNALKEADLVILAGVPNDFRMDYGRSISRKAYLISINLSKDGLKKNRKPDLGFLTSPGNFLIDLAKRVDKWNDSRTKWFETLRAREKGRNDEIFKQSKDDLQRINPLKMSLALDELIDDNSILIGDGGDIIATISYIVQPRKPLSWLDPGPFGTLGVGAGFALASKILFPEKEVFLIYGDGSVGYSLIEWDTFARHNIPIIGIIGNDSAWMQVARGQISYFNDSVGTELGDRHYEKAVTAFGPAGFLVEKEEDLKPTLEKAILLSKQGQSVLVNVMIGRSDFRKGSVSM